MSGCDNEMRWLYVHAEGLDCRRVQSDAGTGVSGRVVGPMLRVNWEWANLMTSGIGRREEYWLVRLNLATSVCEPEAVG